MTARLTAREAEVLELAGRDGMAEREIAALLGVSVWAVRARKRRAVRKLGAACVEQAVWIVASEPR